MEAARAEPDQTPRPAQAPGRGPARAAGGGGARRAPDGPRGVRARARAPAARLRGDALRAAARVRRHRRGRAGRAGRGRAVPRAPRGPADSAAARAAGRRLCCPCEATVPLRPEGRAGRRSSAALSAAVARQSVRVQPWRCCAAGMRPLRARCARGSRRAKGSAGPTRAPARPGLLGANPIPYPWR
jgi:hypothetical protein